jgi:hypothetical protein
MKKLGLQFSEASRVFEADPALNAEMFTPEDRRNIIEKFDFNTSRRHYFYVMSFSPKGACIDVLCTGLGNHSNENDGAHIFIPSGVRVEAQDLAETIDILKEELLQSPRNRQMPESSDYFQFFDNEYDDTVLPAYKTPKSQDVAFIRFGSETETPFLTKIFSNIYRMPYVDFGAIALIDADQGIELKEGVEMQELFNGSCASFGVLRDIVVDDAIKPKYMVVDGARFEKGQPMFVAREFKVDFKHDIYTASPQVCEFTAGGIQRISDIGWTVKISRSEFDIIDKNGEYVDNSNIFINGRPLSKSVVLSVREASDAELVISADDYNTFKENRDLTDPESRKVTLSMGRGARRFWVDDVTSDAFSRYASFEIESNDLTLLRQSPIMGYKIVREDSSGERHLVYDKFAFIKQTQGIVCLVGALLVGLLLGLLIGGGSGEKPEKEKKQKKEKVEKVQTVEPVETADAADATAQPLAQAAAAQPAEQPATQPAAPADANYEAAVKYLSDNNVWNRDEMEKIEGLQGLWSALNYYNAPVLKEYNAKLNVDKLTQIINLIEQKKHKSQYAKETDPVITLSSYLGKFE